MTNMIHFLSFIEFPIEWPIRRSLVLCGGRNSILGTGQGGGGGRGGAGGGGGGGGGGGEGNTQIYGRRLSGRGEEASYNYSPKSNLLTLYIKI